MIPGGYYLRMGGGDALEGGDTSEGEGEMMSKGGLHLGRGGR